MMNDIIFDNLFLEENKNFVSTGTFLSNLWKAYCEGGLKEQTAENPNLLQSEIFRYARKQGWIDEQDILSSDSPIERRTAARIVHEFLRKELKEEDLTDINVANRLVDLFDCRSCVQHVAQVYLKGIIESKQIRYSQEDEMTIFGMRDGIELDEMETIVERIFKKELRKHVE